ncbi:hypothetical protein N7509_009939 [Penicillium cosmopolitanum]|uniref:Ig-like domain-containing protein n=1 Tax=Penicillium cosmopolitanum TaxID=1131564 RepID=A0A9W9VQC0_9EURO|nr:uncharacterized protein N7509_009939 [Penicillium cosmopolitanum]KAJ5387398.1 hypothetical protein N7509_009939 [Penicillium cosmopolitanum]
MSTTIVSTSVTETGHIPLTTNFTPPDSCVSDLWLGSTSGKTWMNLGPISHTECLPSGWAKTSYYSPGICPSGYGIAASGTVIDGSITETAATCCPTLDGHTYVTRPSKSSTASESIDCIWSPGPDVTTEFTYTWTEGDSTSSSSTALSLEEHVNAYGVYIRWQSTDFSTPASNTATTTTGATTAATTSTSTTSSTSTDSSGSSGSSGLSTGAKAGVGVGVAAGAVILIALLALFLIRRRRSKNQPPRPIEMPTGYSQPAQQRFVELSGQQRLVELPTGAETPELDSDNLRKYENR